MSVRAAQSCFWRRAKTTRCSTLNHGERELGADDKVDMVAANTVWAATAADAPWLAVLARLHVTDKEEPWLQHRSESRLRRR